MGEQDRFRELLMDSNIPIRKIVRSELIYGDPFAYKENIETFYDLREKVSASFNVHPHNVLVVGSGKLGFSIAPKKLWKPFDSESDIDVVVVAEKPFIFYWKRLFLFNLNTTRSEDEDSRFLKFKDYFFKGWIRPDLFNFSFEGKNEWFDFFKELSQKNGRLHKVTGALYFNFDFFEEYHSSNLQTIRDMETSRAK